MFQRHYFPRIMLQPNGSGIACNPVVLIISNLLQFIRLVHKVFLFFLSIYLFIYLFIYFIYLFTLIIEQRRRSIFSYFHVQASHQPGY